MKKSSTTPKETAEACTSTFGCSSADAADKLILPDSFEVNDRRWFKTTSLLRADPSLMTSRILIVALKNHAPLHVIKFFLSLNAKAAGIPKEGPTPLQVAVQANASKEVVKELIEACPFALIVTTSAEWLDPLSYARRYRSSETDLIELLSRPLGSWIHPKEKEEAERRESRKSKPRTNIPITIPRVSFAKATPAPAPAPPAPSLSEMAEKQQPTSALSEEDKQELQNVKELCLTVIKGQKRLTREVNRVRDTFEQNPFSGLEDPPSSLSPVTPGNQQVTIQDFQELEKNQKRNLKAHLIALDMKEQAMRAHVSRMENRILESLEATKQDYITEQDSFSGLRDQLQTAANRMDDFIGNLEHRIADFEDRLDNESKINNNFRRGLEHHLGVKTDVSQQEGFEIVSIVENTPFVFATPYRVSSTEEAVPLCPKEGPRERKQPGSCLVWPRFLARRRDPNHTLS